MRISGSIEIDRKIDEVFELTNDHIATWSLTVVEDELLEDKPGRIGTTFRTVTEENGRRMEFQGVVKRYEPPTLSAVYLAGDSFDIDVLYEFEDLGGRTRVTQHSAIKAHGFFRVFLLLFGWMMKGSSCRAVEKEFVSLKAFCESYTGEFSN